jgi:hypothetical protein
VRASVKAIVLVLVALVVVGCSSAAAPTMGSSGVFGNDGGPARQSEAYAPTDKAAEEMQSWDRHIIRNAEMTLVVKDVEASLGEVKTVAANTGGFVTNSGVRRDGEKVFADVTVQVPAETFDRALDDLRALALTVETLRTSTQDVTEEFVDNDAQLRNLRAAETSTLHLMERTEKMEDIISVQRELARLRGDIERIEGRQRYLERRVAMSTINLYLKPPTAASIAAERFGWQPFQTAAIAWEASLGFLVRLVDVLVAALVFLWWTFPLAALFVWLWRRRSQRRRAAPPALKEQGQGSA